jgi:DNA helicase-2/ATP-dependent DNA helicase PcrA
VYPKQRLKTVYFTKGRSPYWESYSDTEKYYFQDGNEIYSDKISQFTIDCEMKSNGLVTKRLTDIYDEIFIDEFQDLAGWDLVLLEAFMKTGIRMLIVGDPRQCTYTTNNAAKYSQYRGIRVLDLVRKWEHDNLCQIENHARSYRCNQKLCDFADMLWSNMEKTVSHNSTITGHDGIFRVSKSNVHEYVKRYKPTLLRYDRKTKETYGYPALNFGNAKGLEFDRVLIIPHGPIERYLQSGDANDVTGSLEKFYVAVTRAKHSVAFLYDGECSIGCIENN